MRAELGDGYATAAWATRPGIPGGADFVMHFWDEAADRLLAKGTKDRPNPLRRFGFITTNSITQVFSRRVIEQRMTGKTPLSLVYAIPDHPWLKAADKAAVRIAMTVAVAGEAEGVLATVVSEDGLNTDTPAVELATKAGHITPGLTLGADLSRAKPLWANDLLCFKGYMPWGSGFIVSADNPAAHELRNKAPERLLTYFNGRDLAHRPRGVFAIDLFGEDIAAIRNELPRTFQHLYETVKPERDLNNRATYRDNWWVFAEPRQGMRVALAHLPKFIATTETSKHRVFAFLPAGSGPDQKLRVIAVDASSMLAVLSSRVHVHFSISNGGWLGVGNDPVYQHTTTFAPFPFPAARSMPPALLDRLSTLSERLDAFRKDRIATHPHLTMTGLYNNLERLRELAAGADVPPLSDAERDIKDDGQVQVLRDLHDDIDRAVLDAYGWSDLAPALVGRPGATTPSPHKSPAQVAAEDQLLVRLVALNQARQVAEAQGEIDWLRPDYQIPRLRSKAPQPDRARQDAADLGTFVEDTQALPWPGDGLDQIRAVRSILAASTAPLAPQDIAGRFRGGRNRAARVETVLRHMVETGMVRTDGRTHFLPR
jgi:hypothetical protein